MHFTRPPRPLHHFVVPLPRFAGEELSGYSSSPACGGGRPEGWRGCWGRTAFGIAPAALIATPALAHPGHHEHMTVAQAMHHLATQPDHQIAFAGLVVAILAGGWFWIRATARK